MNAPWMLVANHLKGVSEVKGAVTNPKIDEMFRISGHGWVDDDETPWCAAFVGACLRLAGYASSGKLNAKSYIGFGDKLGQPRPGCIVVFSRGAKNAPTGHVAFFDHMEGGQLMVLGGNQGNAVSVRAYPKSRVLGYFWPVEQKLPVATSPQLKNILELDPDYDYDEPEGAEPGQGIEADDDGIDDGFEPLSVGAKGSQVKALQQSLTDLGYHLGAVDGDFGPRTRDALMSFQSDQGLSATGVADTVTLAAFQDANHRKEGAERAAATETDLRNKNSRTIKSADIGGWLGIGTAVLGALGVSDKYLGILGGLTNAVKTATGAPVDGNPAAQRIIELIASLKQGKLDDTAIKALDEAVKVLDGIKGTANAGNDTGILGSLADLLQGLVGPGSNGSLLMLLGVGLWVWRQSKRVKQLRVEDHRTGKNLGK